MMLMGGTSDVALVRASYRTVPRSGGCSCRRLRWSVTRPHKSINLDFCFPPQTDVEGVEKRSHYKSTVSGSVLGVRKSSGMLNTECLRHAKPAQSKLQAYDIKCSSYNGNRRVYYRLDRTDVFIILWSPGSFARYWCDLSSYDPRWRDVCHKVAALLRDPGRACFVYQSDRP